MTYHARGRSIAEVIIAVIFVGFLTGFVLVLCIGNYYRAKRAMERQRQRRLAKLSGTKGVTESPRSHASSEYSDEKASLLKRTPDVVGASSGGLSKRNAPPPITEDLLLQEEVLS